ncbi:MoaD/ThiS family protein [Actinotalea ferrariae]|uniref:MoaD/ThiS family protein n=1 Tax=Actinotalea ferrariae TaxID=1386098 RepID=UPI001C8C074F|nr:MoaD/ThiS family protein [Actinotalea ferrariae]MBX9246782.1 MoaD/ThiS family protein [Actinotalea ferrariae]
MTALDPAGGPVTTTSSVTVRYFAAAAEAAGVTTEPVPAGTADAVRAAMVAAHGADLQRVLTCCTLLADGRRVQGDDVVPAGATLDVLPPFAGG